MIFYVKNDGLTVQFYSDKTDRDLVKKAPSAHLVMPPFQIDSNMLPEINGKKIAETWFNKVFLKVKRLGKAFSWTCLN